MKRAADLSRYFSASRLMRLPLYKLAAGGTAALVFAGLGAGVVAAAVNVPQAEPEPTAPAVVEVAPVSAVSTPETAETAQEPIEVQMEVTVVQQDIGVLLYTMATPETPEFDDETDEDSYVADGEIKVPLTGVALNVTITDEEGKANEYPLDVESGTTLAEDVAPGDYTVIVPQLDGYIMPEEQTTTVTEKVVYKADVAAVKDKIVQASQVVESQEDNGGSGAAVSGNVTDTVSYADSASEQTGTKVVYSAKLSGRGYLLDSKGAETPYKPVYDEATKELTGAVRDTAYTAVTTASTRMAAGGIELLGKASGKSVVRTSVESVVAQETAVSPSTAEPTASEAAATPTAEPAETPAVSEEPTAEPTEAPTETPVPTLTATPTAPPTVAPTTDPYAKYPAAIEAAKLAEYGFAVSKSETAVYQYTGWQTIDGSTYYYDPSSHAPVTGTQVIQGNVYTFAADGALNQTARGIDVSKYQGTIDWNAVKADGITFAIIRVGYRGYGSGALVEDSTFRQNIAGATAAGLRVGVYFYSQATTEAEAVEEASMVVSLCGGYSLPCGVYYDTEKVAGDSGRADGISAAQRTACAVAFCETIRSAGYTAGVYSYASWFYNSLNFANISKYRIWIAQYRDTLSFNYHYNIWQYTGSGRVNGCSKAVDMNLG